MEKSHRKRFSVKYRALTNGDGKNTLFSDIWQSFIDSSWAFFDFWQWIHFFFWLIYSLFQSPLALDDPQIGTNRINHFPPLFPGMFWQKLENEPPPFYVKRDDCFVLILTNLKIPVAPSLGRKMTTVFPEFESGVFMFLGT